ncbi:hypothetical protein [Bacillus badius]|uniref:hypothetical protein n=1 Tax=Bacillus badius TaxID=1455 RepID=UPI0012E74E79|nr:hypothetical protein [Bacillus badius]
MDKENFTKEEVMELIRKERELFKKELKEEREEIKQEIENEKFKKKNLFHKKITKRYVFFFLLLLLFIFNTFGTLNGFIYYLSIDDMGKWIAAIIITGWICGLLVMDTFIRQQQSIKIGNFSFKKFINLNQKIVVLLIPICFHLIVVSPFAIYLRSIACYVVMIVYTAFRVYGGHYIRKKI